MQSVFGLTAARVGSIIKCRLNGRACAGTGARLFSDIRWELAFSRVGSLLERRERMSGWSYGDVSERGSVEKHFLSICFEFGNTEGFDGLCKQTMDVLYQKLIVCNVLQCRTAESRRSVFALRLFGSVLKKAGAEKRHTEEVPRRNAASPEWETDIHHHQMKE